MRNKRRQMQLVIFSSIILLLLNNTLFANEDYDAYAREQQEKAKILIAPYEAEVQKIVKNVEKRQAEPDIQAFKKEMQKAARAQCPMRTLISQQEKRVAREQPPIIIFVSFSMPKESIKAWIDQAEKIGAGIYIRGLVNNSFKDTAKAVSDLIQDNKGGLLVDPTLFKKYAIVQVPAVVVVDKDTFDVIYGDVTLDYALEKLNRKISDNNAQRLLSDAINKLQGITK